MVLPVDMIRTVFTEVGATEDQILTAIENYRSMRTTDRKEYLRSLDITMQSMEFMKVLEDAMDIQYDRDGVPESIALKNAKSNR